MVQHLISHFPFISARLFQVRSQAINMVSSFHEDGGVHFSGPVGVCLFIWTVGGLLHMGEVTIRDFPGGIPVPISCPIGKYRTQVCKSEFNKLSKRSL